jgi:hypothetical protein
MVVDDAPSFLLLDTTIAYSLLGLHRQLAHIVSHKLHCSQASALQQLTSFPPTLRAQTSLGEAVPSVSSTLSKRRRDVSSLLNGGGSFCNHIINTYIYIILTERDRKDLDRYLSQYRLPVKRHLNRYFRDCRKGDTQHCTCPWRLVPLRVARAGATAPAGNTLSRFVLILSILDSNRTRTSAEF